MFPNHQFGVIFQLVLGVNNSGHLSHTRYVDHQFTGHQFALCHAIHAGDALDHHQFQATLAIMLLIVLIVLLILSIIHHNIQSSISHIAQSVFENTSMTTFHIVSNIFLIFSQAHWKFQLKRFTNTSTVFDITSKAHFSMVRAFSNHVLKTVHITSTTVVSTAIISVHHLSQNDFIHSSTCTATVLIFSIQSFTYGPTKSITSCVFSLIHKKFVHRATHNAVIATTASHIGHVSIVNHAIIQGNANHTTLSAVASHHNAIQAAITHAESFGFSAIQPLTNSTILIQYAVKSLRYGNNTSQMLRLTISSVSDRVDCNQMSVCDCFAIHHWIHSRFHNQTM